MLTLAIARKVAAEACEAAGIELKPPRANGGR